MKKLLLIFFLLALPTFAQNGAPPIGPLPSSGGGGSGTVTSVSADGVVECGTVTTSGSFTACNAAPNSVLAGPASGGAASPTYQLAPKFSAANLTNFPTFNQNTTGTATNLSGTPALPNGTTATTQSAGDNTTNLATDAFVIANCPPSGAIANQYLLAGCLGGSLNEASGVVTTTEPGSFGASVSTTADGVHPSLVSLVGNTTLPSPAPNTVNLIGPPSATPTAYSIQVPTAIPATTDLLSCVVTSTNCLLTDTGIPATATGFNTTIKTLTGCNTAGFVYTPQAADCVAQSGGSGGAAALSNTTSVTVSNPTAATDTQLMEVSLSAGYLNTAGQPYVVYGAGVLNTTVASVPQVTITAKLCSVSGCGSGTVTSLGAIQSSALNTTAITNATWTYGMLVTTVGTGASCNFISKANPGLEIDLAGTVTATADSVFLDSNTAVTSPNQNCANALFLDFFVQQSTTGSSNSYKQLIAEIAPQATATASSVACGGLPALTGDTTTSAGSCATTTAKINGTAFSGTQNDIVTFGASNHPADSAVLIGNVDQTVFDTQSATLSVVSTNNINATNVLASALANGWYRLSFYVFQVGVGSGCTGTGSIIPTTIYTDPNNSVATTKAMGTWSITTNGTAGAVVTAPQSLPLLLLQAKSATAIQYSVAFTAPGTCTGANLPTVFVTPVLEQLKSPQ